MLISGSDIKRHVLLACPLVMKVKTVPATRHEAPSHHDCYLVLALAYVLSSMYGNITLNTN